MQSANSNIEKKSWRRLMIAAVALGLMSVFAIPQPAQAQTNPLNFGNNYFVTGDYVVAGVGLSGLPQSGGYATGYINMPDDSTVPRTGVPPGAQVVAAFLYWQTVESSSSQPPVTGQIGYFGPASGGRPSGYLISGTALGDPNTPVSWGSGGCAGDPSGSKKITTYRADVRPYLPVDPEGNVLANGKYLVRLASSGSSGSVPLTLGASLVIIYRVMDQGQDNDDPLNSIVIYDGNFVPSNSSSDMTQAIEGFYQAAAHPITKLTEIVGNGGANKDEYVYLDGQYLPSVYGNLPSFPGIYYRGTYSSTGGGSWDNPTWIFQSTDTNNPVQANDSTVGTKVSPYPKSSNGGCVSWGAVIFSTTVQDTDHDGLLDKWETQGGYCDASVNGGVCTHSSTDPAWVSLPDEPDLPGMQEPDPNPTPTQKDDPSPDKKDIYVQMDYMCRNPGATTCQPTDTASYLPSQSVIDNLESVFASHGIVLHLILGNAIPEDTCSDAAIAPNLCQYPDQSDVVAWKGGFTYLKNQPLNYPDEDSCENALDGPCVRRFQHGRKDSYHYVLFGNALGVPQWSLLGGTLTGVTLTSVTQNVETLKFTTSAPTNLQPYSNAPGAPNGRVTVSGATSNPSMNGTFPIQSVSPSGDPTSFTINVPTSPESLSKYTWLTDPHLTVASGQAGTISGASDVGGEDTAITLGSWGPDGKSDTVQEGVLMHELGHTLGLTHGGTYYASSSDVPTYGPNCKPNYQSVMNYLFTVDLLGTSQALDYSEQKLSPIDENGLPAGVTTTAGSAPLYPTTKWYSPSPADGVGSKATVHCDGTPAGNEVMYRVSGTADPISPTSTWSTGGSQDVDFNGVIDTGEKELQGYDDWTNLDLQQMGAAGNLSTAGGPGTSFNFGPGTSFNFGPGTSFNFGPGTSFNFGPGDGEITLAQANSVTRPPRDLTATVTRSKTNTIELDWSPPTFGQIGTYNIYQGVGGNQPAPPKIGTETSTQHFVYDVSCKQTYTYFVTAVLQGTSQESQPSNTVTVINCKVQ